MAELTRGSLVHGDYTARLEGEEEGPHDHGRVKEWYETLPDEAVVYRFQVQLQIPVSTSMLQWSWQLGGDMWSLRLLALPLTRRHVSRG